MSYFDKIVSCEWFVCYQKTLCYDDQVYQLDVLRGWISRLDSSHISYYCERFINNDFTSVDHYFRIENEFIPRATNDIVKTYVHHRFRGSRQGRDLYKSDLLMLGDECYIQAVRPKIDGIPFVKEVRTTGTFLCGDYDIKVEPDFLVEFAECCNGVFYILSPYGRGSFEAYGKKFQFNEWSNSGCSDEGAVCLINGEERRIKRFPTVEVLVTNQVACGRSVEACDGVWEVTTDGFDIIPVRPRPERAPTSNPWEMLFSLPFFGEIEHMFPLAHSVQYSSFERGYDISKETFFVLEELYVTGSQLEPVSTDPSRFSVYAFCEDILDRQRILKTSYGMCIETSSRRIHLCEPYPPLLIAQQQYRACSGRDVYITAMTWKSVVSASKMFLFSGWSLALVRESGKPFDLIGGKCEEGETPDETIRREFVEETGAVCPDPVYLGVSVGLENGVMYRTYMYFGVSPYLRNENIRYTLIPFIPGYCQSWMTRFLVDFQRYIPSLPIFSVARFHETITCDQSTAIVQHVKFKQYTGIDMRDVLFEWMNDCQRIKVSFMSTVRSRYCVRNYGSDVVTMVVSALLGKRYERDKGSEMMVSSDDRIRDGQELSLVYYRY